MSIHEYTSYVEYVIHLVNPCYMGFPPFDDMSRFVELPGGPCSAPTFVLAEKKTTLSVTKTTTYLVRRHQNAMSRGGET